MFYGLRVCLCNSGKLWDTVCTLQTAEGQKRNLEESEQLLNHRRVGLLVFEIFCDMCFTCSICVHVFYFEFH